MLETNVENIRALREAKEEARQMVAIKMLRKNLDLEMIVEFTGLTIAQVQALQVQTESQ